MMKRVWTFVLFLFLSLCAMASEGSASLFTPYPGQNGGQTRAPFGYKPFYISHFGRHGCRYMSSGEQVAVVLDVLEAAHQQRLLTAEGLALYQDFLAFDAAEEGMYGQLSERGGIEHAGISQRMFRHFRPVFTSRKRRIVRGISSMYPRCVLSMTHFCMELKSRAPRLKMDLSAGVKYYKRLNTPDSTRALVEIRSRGEAYLNPKFPSFFDDTAFFGRVFKDPAAARNLSADWTAFFMRLYDCMCNVDCVGLDIGLKRYLTEEEFTGLMHFRNCIIFAEDGRNPLNWDARKPLVRVFLKEMLDKADEAVAGNEVAADLRFGHDSGLSGLMSLIGVAGYDVESDPADAWKVWDAAEMMPMASNMQWVFYRSRFKKEILVKILFNEKETSIPALGPGPYYQWTDLRAYLMSL